MVDHLNLLRKAAIVVQIIFALTAFKRGITCELNSFKDKPKQAEPESADLTVLSSETQRTTVRTGFNLNDT